MITLVITFVKEGAVNQLVSVYAGKEICQQWLVIKMNEVTMQGFAVLHSVCLQ